MKKMLLVLLAFLPAACSAPAAAVTATSAIGANPAGQAETPTAAPPTAAVPAALPTPMETVTPAPAPTVTATPFTEPGVAARFPMYMHDNLGLPGTLLALPGGQVWETTSGGGVRIYGSADMAVLKSLDLGVRDKQFSRLVGDEQYVWALFYSSMEGSNPARLFRISRADFSYRPVELPGDCTYDACLWSYPLVDGDILWLGGYDELWGFDRETLRPVAQFLVSEQAHTFAPLQVLDIDVTDGGQVWALFCLDVCDIVILDRQKLLEGAQQEPGHIYFVNNSVQFVTALGGTMWAGEMSSGNVGAQPAVLYPLDGEIEADLSPQDGIALPDGLDFMEAVSGRSIAGDGKYLWVRDTGGRRLFWFDPLRREVAGVLQIYPGDEPTAADPRTVFSISFDGEYLWAGGTEILRIAIPRSK